MLTILRKKSLGLTFIESGLYLYALRLTYAK
jgi:hypothetical protein